MISAYAIRKLAASAAIAALCVAGVWAGRHLWGPAGPETLSRDARARARGNPSAPVWVVEYFDFGCRGCATASRILEEHLRLHPDALYAQTRYYPLIKRERSYGLKAAIYAECASRQGKFWLYHDRLFESQEEWTVSEDPDALFGEYADALGLDRGRLDACVRDTAVKDLVLKEKADAIDLGVTMTPTFFVNGKMVVGPESLEQALREHFPPAEAGP